MKTTSFLLALPLAAIASAKAPLIKKRSDLVSGQKYVVMFHDEDTRGGNLGLMSAVKGITATADHLFDKLGAFAADLTDDEVENLRNDPSVKYVEQNSLIKIFETQKDADWGLTRLSSKEPGSTDYIYQEDGGDGVCAYIIDTGVDTTHKEFQGRAEFVATFVDNIKTDDHGHGTHCAGTIGSKTYGVAKNSTLLGVKAFNKDGESDTATMIAAMEKVQKDAAKRDCPNGVVINMSFGDESSKSVNEAAAALVKDGYFVSVAAGNGNELGVPQDAGNWYPASEPSVCTVGASDDEDKVASFSNYGKVVDLYAPGVSIKSTIPRNLTATMSGTSMASPHIAGLGAYFMSMGKKADDLCDYMKSIALKGALSGVPNGTVNLLAQNGEA